MLSLIFTPSLHPIIFSFSVSQFTSFMKADEPPQVLNLNNAVSLLSAHCPRHVFLSYNTVHTEIHTFTTTSAQQEKTRKCPQAPSNQSPAYSRKIPLGLPTANAHTQAQCVPTYMNTHSPIGCVAIMPRE